MSDTMLHGVLQMPPELWTNDAIDTAHRHSRYLEASKRIEQLEYERDEARMKRDDVMRLTERQWLLKVACRLVSAGCKSEGILESLDEVIRERDQARKELAELRKNSLALVEELKKSVIRLAKERDEALESLSNVRKELVASNRGAEKNAKVNQGLCAKLAEAERERDEARRDLKHTEEYGTEEINAAVSLRQELTKARFERDEAMQMLGEQLYQRVNEWTDEVSRLLGELNAAREEVSALKAKLDRVSQMNQHADKSSVGDSTYVLTEQPCQRASRVRNC